MDRHYTPFPELPRASISLADIAEEEDIAENQFANNSTNSSSSSTSSDDRKVTSIFSLVLQTHG